MLKLLVRCCASQVLDYFHSMLQLVPSERRLFCFDKSNEVSDGDLAFIDQVRLSIPPTYCFSRPAETDPPPSSSAALRSTRVSS